jgi:hypothetical protein
VFKNKTSSDGNFKKYKVRLVVKAYSKAWGIYFSEIFSLVSKLTSIRFLLYVATTFDLQIDVKTIFLHGDLKEENYMT